MTVDDMILKSNIVYYTDIMHYCKDYTLFLDSLSGKEYLHEGKGQGIIWETIEAGEIKIKSIGFSNILYHNIIMKERVT